MEAVLLKLPEAARIAARASASVGQAQAANESASSELGSRGTGAEPTLAELLRAQQFSLGAEGVCSCATHAVRVSLQRIRPAPSRWPRSANGRFGCRPLTHIRHQPPSQSLSGVVWARYAQDPGLEDAEEFFKAVDEA